MRKKYTLLLISLFLITTAGLTQTVTPKRVKVFLDCSNTWCDETFIRTEINIIDFVIDRISADIHLLITSQETGSAGQQFQLLFIHQQPIRKTDTLRFETKPLATAATIREQLVKHIQIGLIGAIAKSGFAEEISIQTKVNNSTSPTKNNGNQNTKDKWNYWNFRAGMDGSFNSDQNYSSRNLGGRFSANRITNDLKILFNFSGNDNRNRFSIDEDVIKVKNNSFLFLHQLAKSINSHWSLGYEIAANRNTFNNIRSLWYFSPGIEYNIYPYSSVNSKLLTIRYGADIRHNRYFDTSIFNKKSEYQSGHNLSVYLSLNQKWGSVSTGFYYRNYFNNWKQMNISFNSYVEIRLNGSLSFYVYAYPTIVRDQIFLPKGEASSDDILSRRRQLQTNYFMYMGAGFTYRFGTILNNFINPRFNSGGAAFYFN